MHLTFRPLRPSELSEASRLVDAAYAPQLRRLYGNSPLGRWRHYDEAKIEDYMAREPEGVRVGEWKERLIAFHVCRSYGRLGWFHTLAIHPHFQNRGLGRQAVADAEAYLYGRGVTAIALMTWPTAINNLGFYLRLGYRVAGHSLYAFRQNATSLAFGLSPFYASEFPADAVQNGRIEEGVRLLCQHIYPGLDYLPWLRWTRQTSFAKTLLIWRDQRLEALFLAYFFPNMHWTEGKLLLLSPDLTPSERLWVLEHMRLWSLSRGRSAFGFPVELNTEFVRQILLPHGFRLSPESMVNLVKGDDLPNPEHHHVRFGG